MFYFFMQCLFIQTKNTSTIFFHNGSWSYFDKAQNNEVNGNIKTVNKAYRISAIIKLQMIIKQDFLSALSLL